MGDSGFKFLDHTADVQSKSWGNTLEEAFSQTALSLIATITPGLEMIEKNQERILKLEAEDKGALLFDFLSELLYIFDVDQLVFSEINVKNIDPTSKGFKMEAELKGEIFDKEKHEIGTEVKAITYSFMEIKEEKNRVVIKIVFDI